MKDFTREYNVEMRRAAFWNELSGELTLIGELLYQQEEFSAQDRKAIEKLREILIESYRLSERQRGYHSRRLERLRKEYLYGD